MVAGTRGSDVAIVKTKRTETEVRPLVNRAYDIYSVPKNRSKNARKVTSFTDVNRVQYSMLDEAFTPAWDDAVASEQAMKHVKERVDMGQKRTPRGGGSLRPARR